MVTSVITNYLEDKLVDKNKKVLLLERLELNYSDIIYLLDLYKYETEIERLLKSIYSFEDSKLTAKIRKQNRDMNKSYIYRRMKKVRREKSYD